jgi:hypothetical protein
VTLVANLLRSPACAGYRCTRPTLAVLPWRNRYGRDGITLRGGSHETGPGTDGAEGDGARTEGGAARIQAESSCITSRTARATAAGNASIRRFTSPCSFSMRSVAAASLSSASLRSWYSLPKPMIPSFSDPLQNKRNARSRTPVIPKSRANWCASLMNPFATTSDRPRQPPNSQPAQTLQHDSDDRKRLCFQNNGKTRRGATKR